MVREVNLLEYLPPFVQEYREIQGIMNAEKPEFQAVEDDSEIIKNNMFILHTDTLGIERYENMLHLTSAQSDTLYNRQMKVLARYTNSVIYTFRGLTERLNAMCGVGNYVIDLNANEYRIDIALPLKVKSSIKTILAMLENMIPANMICTYSFIPNTHKVLSAYPQYLLMQFTHEELRSELIEDNISTDCDNLTNYEMQSFEAVSCENITNYGMRKV